MQIFETAFISHDKGGKEKIEKIGFQAGKQRTTRVEEESNSLLQTPVGLEDCHLDLYWRVFV